MSDSLCRDDHGHLGYVVECQTCEGFGSMTIDGHIYPCPECNGTGAVWIAEEDYFEPPEYLTGGGR